ncbi:hypothetical protein [Streptomyces sp. AK02-01A]|uniref:hypothetical protein n=1 Tax=Streptomyces sp. AK02-01A TaxID=3028648 RepID=UPI0029B4F488|nr:hypothetical protein [Streptomyces sp. AK02-01A]MDX3852100.1 hypothetical protein [Streptomyces sp. AK02-01A]
MTRTGRVAGPALAALLLTGCGGGGTDPSDRDPSDSATRPAASATAPATAATAPADPGTPSESSPPVVPPRMETLVTVTRSGGLAGRHDSVIVYSDGSYTTLVKGRTGTSGRMAAGELAELRAALSASGIERLPRVLFDRPAPDAFLYAIAYQGREVVMSDAQPVPTVRRVVAAAPLPS